MKIQELLSRLFIEENQFEDSIRFYEKLFNEKYKLKFQYAEAKLSIAQIGSILLIAGTPDARKRFETTKITMIVDSLNDSMAFLLSEGVEILEEPKDVPTGKNMRVKHPDGTVVEYVELKK